MLMLFVGTCVLVVPRWAMALCQAGLGSGSSMNSIFTGRKVQLAALPPLVSTPRHHHDHDADHDDTGTLMGTSFAHEV